MGQGVEGSSEKQKTGFEDSRGQGVEDSRDRVKQRMRFFVCHSGLDPESSDFGSYEIVVAAGLSLRS